MKRAVLVLLIVILFIITYPAFSGYNLPGALPAHIKPLLSPVVGEEAKKMTELRVMTYNIRHGLGIDGQLDLDRVFETIRAARADVVGLNEVDVNMVRSGMTNQSAYLGQKLLLNSAFVPSINFILGQYGNGLLSRYPITKTTRVELPRFQKREQRSLGIFTLRLEERDVYILVTHLGLNPVERARQLAVLTERVLELQGPVMVLGDFNATETSSVVQDFLQTTGLTVHSYLPTFPADEPGLKLDYILTSNDWEMSEEIEVIASLASDHLPVVGKFRLKPLIQDSQ